MAFFDRDSLVVSGLIHPQRDSLSPSTVRLQMAILFLNGLNWSHEALKFFKGVAKRGDSPFTARVRNPQLLAYGFCLVCTQTTTCVPEPPPCQSFLAMVWLGSRAF